VKITADTNVLLRAFLEDDTAQAAHAKAILDQVTLIAIPVPVLCEFAWALRRLYKLRSERVADAIEAILNSTSVVTDRLAAEAGLGVLRAGGDFADGVIAWQGMAMGGESLVTFDREAVRLLTALGIEARVAAP
jgi:predicted nucleic-acid-binding protein